jgi:hypothetical protein
VAPLMKVVVFKLIFVLSEMDNDINSRPPDQTDQLSR